ncbi:MAG: hemerythrin domain-containing protein [Nanoarchaeota archaeon]|nr:hemerythrin domain-containing protein [Nanoarchaeota archaeon]
MISIEKLMMEEHKRVAKFLENLENDLDNYEKTKENFNKFKWNLEKHFFTEEKVIFNMFVQISGQETSDTFHLLSDHVKIMQMIRQIERGLSRKIKPKIHVLKEMLTRHKNFEDSDFYPKLDERLTSDQKKEISMKIKEIILG